MSKPIDKVLTALEDKGCKPKKSGGSYAAKCPAHNGKDFDSLTISEGLDGTVLVRCQSKGCTFDSIVESLGLSKSDFFPDGRKKKKQPTKAGRSSGKAKLIAEHQYSDERGNHLFTVNRYKPRKFSQWRPDGKGGRVWKLSQGWFERAAKLNDWYFRSDNPDRRPKPTKPSNKILWFDTVDRVLYRLPQLLESDPTEWVFVPEGEKDVDRLVELGFVATTNPGGAGKWNLIDRSPLFGRKVLIIPDNDTPGEKHADEVAKSLNGKTQLLRVLRLKGLKKGGDVSDWLDSGHNRKELLTLVESTPDWEPNNEDPITLDLTRLDDVGWQFVTRYRERKHGFALIFYERSFYVWDGARYAPVEVDLLRSEIYNYIRSSVNIKGAELSANRSKVDQVIDALKAFTALPRTTVAPVWLDSPAERPDPKKVLSSPSGILDLTNGRLLAPTPEFFTFNALDYEADPNAPEPIAWLKFLDDLWPDDPARVQLLQEWFGYCLTTETRYHKILYLFGQKRAGKSTIVNVLGQVVGESNVASPTFSSFASNFGLQPLIGKTLATVSDIRISRQTDNRTVLGRFLTISGGDPLTIDRKHTSHWTGKLLTRLVLTSNELLDFYDPSGALASRLLVLPFERSWEGNEDTHLFDKLIKEKTGILNWAINGLDRLREHDEFTQCEQGIEIRQEIADSSSTFSQFAQDECNVAPGVRVTIASLTEAYNAWRDRNGMKTVTPQICGKELKNSHPQIKKRRGTGEAFYEGIELKSK